MKVIDTCVRVCVHVYVCLFTCSVMFMNTFRHRQVCGLNSFSFGLSTHLHRCTREARLPLVLFIFTSNRSAQKSAAATRGEEKRSEET